MADKIDRLISVVLTLAGAAIAVAFVHREFGTTPSARSASIAKPTFIKSWTNLALVGRRLGPDRAPVSIDEFADFECPYCRRADSVFRSVRREFGDSISVVFIHDPLGGHRFARPAAVAAKCASQQHRFEELHDRLYEKQDSLWLKSWMSFASDAGIADTVEFQRCLASDFPIAMIDAGISAARSLNVHATPTILVNGWRLGSPPDSVELTRIIRAILSGHSPFGASN